MPRYSLIVYTAQTVAINVTDFMTRFIFGYYVVIKALIERANNGPLFLPALVIFTHTMVATQQQVFIYIVQHAETREVLLGILYTCGADAIMITRALACKCIMFQGRMYERGLPDTYVYEHKSTL